MTFKQLRNELEGKVIPILLFSPNFKTGTPVTAMSYNRNKNILCFSHKEDNSHTGNEVLLSNMALNRAKGMRVPDDLYVTSPRKYTGDYDEIDYPIGFLTRKVTGSGEIIVNSIRVSIGFALRGLQVGLKPLREANTYEVYLTDFLLGTLHSLETEP